MASSYNHSKEQAIRVCVNSIILRIETSEIGQPINIRTRDNKGGTIINQKHINVTTNDSRTKAIEWSIFTSITNKQDLVNIFKTVQAQSLCSCIKSFTDERSEQVTLTLKELDHFYKEQIKKLLKIFEQ